MAKFRAALANMSDFTASRFSRECGAGASTRTGGAVVVMLLFDAPASNQRWGV